MAELIPDILVSEYHTVVHDVGVDATDEQIVVALSRETDWTEHGARQVLNLARKYGMSVLRNALALASALNIEDGEAGL